MPISTRSVRSAPRVRVIVGAVLGALLAALILSGRITLDQIIGYVAAVASIVLAVTAWAKGRRPAAIAPALASAVMIVVVSVFGAEQFFGI